MTTVRVKGDSLEAPRLEAPRLEAGGDVVSADVPPDTSDGCGEQIALDRLDERLGALRLPRPQLCRGMAESLSRYGQLSTVLAADTGDALWLVDGFKRLAAARRLAWGSLRVQVRLLSEQAAVAALYSLNSVSQGLTDLEEARVVAYLHRQLGMTQLEVGELLGRGKSWVSRRLSLIERLDEDVQRDIQVGLLSATVGRELTRLPRGNQAEVAATVCSSGLTTREASALVARFAETPDRAGQKYLLEKPREALAALSSSAAGRTAPDPRLGLQCNRLRGRLLRIHDEAAWLTRQLSEIRPASWTQTERQIIAPLLLQTEGAVALLATAITPVSHALEQADDT